MYESFGANGMAKRYLAQAYRLYRSAYQSPCTTVSKFTLVYQVEALGSRRQALQRSYQNVCIHLTKRLCADIYLICLAQDMTALYGLGYNRHILQSRHSKVKHFWYQVKLS